MKDNIISATIISLALFVCIAASLSQEPGPPQDPCRDYCVSCQEACLETIILIEEGAEAISNGLKAASASDIKVDDLCDRFEKLYPHCEAALETCDVADLVFKIANITDAIQGFDFETAAIVYTQGYAELCEVLVELEDISAELVKRLPDRKPPLKGDKTA